MVGQRVIYDFYSKEAKRLGYVARSAFKLLELQKRFGIIPRKGRVLDLGCHPGAWLQVACSSLGPHGGQVVGVDIQATELPSKYCDSRVRILQADARDLTAAELWTLQPKGFHTVISDMCPATSGNPAVDVLQSLDLQKLALRIAVGDRNQETSGDQGDAVLSAGNLEGVLVPRGSIVMKLLEGSGSREFGKDLKAMFEKVSWLRPEATRDQSREIYLVGQGLIKPHHNL